MKESILKLYLIIADFIPAQLNLLGKIVLLGFWTQFQCGGAEASHNTKQFSNHELGVLQLNSILIPSIWRQTPLVEGSVPQDRSPLLRMPVESQATWTSDTLATYWRFQEPPPTQDANHKPRFFPVLLTNLL